MNGIDSYHQTKDIHLPGAIIGEISDLARKNHIQQVVLFGSRAKGNNGSRSDIDIAVFGGDFNGFYWDIKETVNSLLSFDIIDMNQTVSDELLYEIRKDGIVLYEKIS